VTHLLKVGVPPVIVASAIVAGTKGKRNAGAILRQLLTEGRNSLTSARKLKDEAEDNVVRASQQYASAMVLRDSSRAYLREIGVSLAALRGQRPTISHGMKELAATIRISPQETELEGHRAYALRDDAHIAASMALATAALKDAEAAYATAEEAFALAQKHARDADSQHPALFFAVFLDISHERHLRAVQKLQRRLRHEAAAAAKKALAALPAASEAKVETAAGEPLSPLSPLSPRSDTDPPLSAELLVIQKETHKLNAEAERLLAEREAHEALIRPYFESIVTRLHRSYQAQDDARRHVRAGIKQYARRHEGRQRIVDSLEPTTVIQVRVIQTPPVSSPRPATVAIGGHDLRGVPNRLAAHPDLINTSPSQLAPHATASPPPTSSGVASRRAATDEHMPAIDHLHAHGFDPPSSPLPHLSDPGAQPAAADAAARPAAEGDGSQMEDVKYAEPTEVDEENRRYLLQQQQMDAYNRGYEETQARRAQEAAEQEIERQHRRRLYQPSNPSQPALYHGEGLPDPSTAHLLLRPQSAGSLPRYNPLPSLFGNPPRHAAPRPDSASLESSLDITHASGPRICQSTPPQVNRAGSKRVRPDYSTAAPDPQRRALAPAAGSSLPQAAPLTQEQKDAEEKATTAAPAPTTPQTAQRAAPRSPTQQDAQLRAYIAGRVPHAHLPSDYDWEECNRLAPHRCGLIGWDILNSDTQARAQQARYRIVLYGINSNRGREDRAWLENLQAGTLEAIYGAAFDQPYTQPHLYTAAAQRRYCTPSRTQPAAASGDAEAQSTSTPVLPGTTDQSGLTHLPGSTRQRPRLSADINTLPPRLRNPEQPREWTVAPGASSLPALPQFTPEEQGIIDALDDYPSGKKPPQALQRLAAQAMERTAVGRLDSSNARYLREHGTLAQQLGYGIMIPANPLAPEPPLTGRATHAEAADDSDNTRLGPEEFHHDEISAAIEVTGAWNEAARYDKEEEEEEDGEEGEEDEEEENDEAAGDTPAAPIRIPASTAITAPPPLAFSDIPVVTGTKESQNYHQQRLALTNLLVQAKQAWHKGAIQDEIAQLDEKYRRGVKQRALRKAQADAAAATAAAAAAAAPAAGRPADTSAPLVSVAPTPAASTPAPQQPSASSVGPVPSTSVQPPLSHPATQNRRAVVIQSEDPSTPDNAPMDFSSPEPGSMEGLFPSSPPPLIRTDSEIRPPPRSEEEFDSFTDWYFQTLTLASAPVPGQEVIRIRVTHSSTFRDLPSLKENFTGNEVETFCRAMTHHLKMHRAEPEDWAAALLSRTLPHASVHHVAEPAANGTDVLRLGSIPYHLAINAILARFGRSDEQKRDARRILREIRMGAVEPAAAYFHRWTNALTQVAQDSGTLSIFGDAEVQDFIRSLPPGWQERCSKLTWHDPRLARLIGTNLHLVSSIQELRDAFLAEDRHIDPNARRENVIRAMAEQVARQNGVVGQFDALSQLAATQQRGSQDPRDQHGATPRLEPRHIELMHQDLQRRFGHSAADAAAGYGNRRGSQSPGNSDGGFGNRNRRGRRSGPEGQPSHEQQHDLPRNAQGKFLPRNPQRGTSPPARPPERPGQQGRWPSSRARQTNITPSHPSAANSTPIGSRPPSRSTAADFGSTGQTATRNANSSYDTGDRGTGPCSDCGHPFHDWAHCNRNPTSPFYTTAAGFFQGKGKRYTGTLDPNGRALLAETKPKLGVNFRTQRIQIDSQGKREVVLDCFVGRVPIMGALGDSGSQGSLMSEELYLRHAAQLGPLDKRAAGNMSVEGINGTPMQVTGLLRTRLTFPDEKTQHNYVTPSPVTLLVVRGITTDLLLGLDVIRGTDGITAINFETGELRFGEGMEKLPFIPVSEADQGIKVRLLRALFLRPGETRPVALRFDAAPKANNATPLLLGNLTLRSTDGTQFNLALPEALYELAGDDGDREIVAAVTNPLPTCLRIREDVAVGIASPIAADHALRLDFVARPSISIHQHPLRRESATHAPVPRRLTGPERSRWLQDTTNAFVRTLVDGMEETPPHATPSYLAEPMDTDSTPSRPGTPRLSDTEPAPPRRMALHNAQRVTPLTMIAASRPTSTTASGRPSALTVAAQILAARQAIQAAVAQRQAPSLSSPSIPRTHNSQREEGAVAQGRPAVHFRATPNAHTMADPRFVPRPYTSQPRSILVGTPTPLRSTPYTQRLTPLTGRIRQRAASDSRAAAERPGFRRRYDGKRVRVNYVQTTDAESPEPAHTSPPRFPSPPPAGFERFLSERNQAARAQEAKQDAEISTQLVPEWQPSPGLVAAAEQESERLRQEEEEKEMSRLIDYDPVEAEFQGRIELAAERSLWDYARERMFLRATPLSEPSSQC
jgi:hypothetical protein